jgi:hypothetical protein
MDGYTRPIYRHTRRRPASQVTAMRRIFINTTKHGITSNKMTTSVPDTEPYLVSSIVLVRGGRA